MSRETHKTSGSGSQQRLDDAQTALDVVTAQLAAQRAERATLQAQLEEGQVLAPAAGRILHVQAVAGAVVLAGETIATLASDEIVLRLSLPERHAQFLKVGDPVLVGERGLGGRGAGEPLRRGTIRLVYPELVEGRVIADATLPGLSEVFVGERVRVLVATGHRDTILIPQKYLFRRFSLDYVRRAPQGDNRGGDTVVQTGQATTTTGEIEILSGLRPGDVLVQP